MSNMQGGLSPEQQVNWMEQQLKVQESVQDVGFSWELTQLQESVQGEWLGPCSETPVRFSGVSTDSRNIKPGDLYIAIKGERFDGHAFIQDAVKQGAAAVLVSEMVDCAVPAILVEDTRLALGQFARWHRRQMPLKKLVAVTGSNGKTTTKAMLLNLFSNVGKTLATEGNLNNDFGVPRTLLNLRPEHEFAIIEMGANHLKEIEYLTLLAEPDIALLNNASGAHLEGFGSLQGVIETKGEIFLGLNRLHAGGWAILNTDSPGFDYWQAEIARLGVEHSLCFGEAESADVRLLSYTADSEMSRFELSVKGQLQTVTMPLLGKHNALNATACVAVCVAAGLEWPQILPGLLSFGGVAGRLQKTRLPKGWLIDDSYNANPASVKAGIDTLVSLPGRCVLCLGAMGELGAGSEAAHQEIAAYAREKGVDYLLVYGEAARIMPQEFGEQAAYFDAHQQMAERVLQLLAQGLIDNVLVKGSRSARMEKVMEPIKSAQAIGHLD